MAIFKLFGVKIILKIIICFSILCFIPTPIFAGLKTRNSLLEQENEAVKLSKIWNADSYKKATTQFEQTAADWESIGEISKAVFCLNEAAKLSQISSDYKTSFLVLNKAIKLSSRHNLNAEKTISLSLFALISRLKGDTANSSKYSEEALNISKTSNSPLARGYALLSAGMHSFYYGKIDKTIELFEEADKNARQTSDIELIIQVLLYKGYSSGRNGQPVNGLKYMQLSLQRSEESNYIRGVALSYFGLGFLNMLNNEKQKAITFYQKAEENFPEEFEWVERAKLYSNLGVICEEYGDIDMAEIYREKAYLFYNKANYPFGALTILPNLANIKSQKGNPEEARKILEQAIVLAKANKNEFYVGIAKEGLGNLELKTGAYDLAIKNYQEALKIYQEIGINLPRIENNIGKAFEKKGDYIAAKSFYNKALTINTEIKDSLPASENLFNLAKLNLTEGNIETANEQILKSLEITEHLYSDVLNSNLKRSYFSSVYDRFEFYIHLLMQKHKQFPDKGFDLQALQISEKSRSRSMLESLQLSEADFVKDAEPKFVEREKEIKRLLNQNTDRLTELLSSKSESREITNIENEIVSLENELEDIKSRFKQNSPIYSSIKNPISFDIKQFQQNILDENSLLLEFSLGEKESYLWLISKNEVLNIILPPRKQIENRIDKIRQTFESRHILPNEEIADYQKRLLDLERIFNQEAQLLSNDLLGKISEKLENNRLIIIPDGKLSLLPLSALPIPNSEELLISKHEIVYEPSATFFNVFNSLTTQAKLPTKELLIFADPVFSDTDTRLLAKKEGQTHLPVIVGLNLRDFRLLDSNGKIPRLFATQDEAEAIATTVGLSSTIIASGFTANRERVLNADISDYRILHFATHGLVDFDHPQVSSIMLSQFDENGQKMEGFLRLQDIYSLNLASELVVLSACQTGAGKEIKGEGLMSLNNAFLQAGAKTVMASAWKVDDNATAELMKIFYQNLTENRFTPSESLRLAQIQMSKSAQYKSPFYWAAFTVQGEFRKSITSQKNYSNQILIFIFALLGFAFYWYLRKTKIY